MVVVEMIEMVVANVVMAVTIRVEMLIMAVVMAVAARVGMGWKWRRR